MTSVGTPGVVDEGHALVLRSGGRTLDLIGLAATSMPWWFQVGTSLAGTSWGNPEAVVTSIQSQLLDGDVGAITSYGNRVVTIALRIIGHDAAELAYGEKALVDALRYTGQLAEIIWTPPGANAVPTVYEVVYGDPQFQFADTDELLCRRTYILTLTCRPFARSLEDVIVAALESGATPTTVTTMDAAGSWFINDVPGDFGHTTWTAGTPVDCTSTPFISLQVTTQTYYGAAAVLRIKVNDVYVTPFSMSSVWSGSSQVWTVALYSAGPVSTIEVIASSSDYMGVTSMTSAILKRSNQDPNSTSFAKTLQFPVYGSMRTEGSLIIKADSTGTATFNNPDGGQNDILVHACPAEIASVFDPALMQYLTAGLTRTPNANMASGATSDLDIPHTFTIPAGNLPEGTFQLYVRLAARSVPARNLTCHVVFNAGFDADIHDVSCAVAAGNDHLPGRFAPLATLVLPPRRVRPGALGSPVVNLTISADGALEVDDLYLLWVAPSGSLDQRSGHVSVMMGVNSGAKTFEIQAPSITSLRASYWSDGIEVGPSALRDAPEFTPGVQSVYLVAAGVPGATVAASYPVHWHTHAAPLPAGVETAA